MSTSAFFRIASSSKTFWRATLASAPVAVLAGIGYTTATADAPRPAGARPGNDDEAQQHRILILGGGTAGVGIAAQLRNKGESDVAIVEPKDVHYYQPMWTLVGGGIKSNTQSKKPFSSVLPTGVQHIPDAAASIDPETNVVTTKGGLAISYDYLIVATGMETHFDRVEGLQETIGKNGVHSIYDYDYSQDTQKAIDEVKAGTMIFTQHSDSPIKCGGAPQKIMWLADDKARRNGYRKDVEIKWVAPQPTMFPVKKYGDILGELAEERDIQRHHGLRLAKVDGPKHEATFEEPGSPQNRVVMKFDLLHIVPFMTPPAAVAESKLANSAGFVDVDRDTLQHKKYPNVFAAGDSSSLPTSKTMAAVAKQAPVLVHNLLAHDKAAPLTAKYDGYTSCPITVASDRLLLAEFKYGGELAETFPFLQDKPRRVFMFLKETLFPIAYFQFFLRGYWYGPRTVFPPHFPETAQATE